MGVILRKSADAQQAVHDAAAFIPVHGSEFAEADRGRYRLFVGPKGNLAQAKMTNVVSDSEGDIFATKTGSLRLILDRRESSWIENDKPKPLRLVPVEDNLSMIYNDLGIYSGERLGTPCDDF